MSSQEIQLILHDYALPILIAFVLAWVIHRMGHWLLGRVMGLSNFAPEGLRPTEERRRSLQDILASTITFLAFLFALFFAVGRFIDTTTLVWIIGLFSAGIGIGARPIISDFITGVSFIFEDTFDVGEKVEMVDIEGIVEKINLRTTFVRAPTGELFVIPNGEIRTIRNFSRAQFSSANIHVILPAEKLQLALPVLENLGQEAHKKHPEMIEPWHIINTTGKLKDQAELTLTIQTQFGHAAELRPKLFALIHEHLAATGITLSNRD